MERAYQEVPRNAIKPPDKGVSLEGLRDTITIKTKIQAEITRSIRAGIKDEGFRGEPIQVLPDSKDKTVIYIKTSHAQVQLDLHYDETKEHMDSLRKDNPLLPEISITCEIDDELYSIDGYDVEDMSRITGELLKQIERKKNPEAFGYKEVQFGILRNNTIIVAGRQHNGEVKKLNFFEFIDDEQDRIMLYGYIAHYFGKPLDAKVFEKLENGDHINPDTRNPTRIDPNKNVGIEI